MAIDQSKAQKRLGKVIRELRCEFKLSQEDFAAKCELHRTYMGAIERGERNISLMNILRVANALKIKPSMLLEKAKL